jgi:V/A-type H+-transporting ATPase subunit I
MIVYLHKILLYGSAGELHRFFELAQRAGFVEFIGDSKHRSLELPESVKTLLSAIRIAKRHEIHPKQAPLLPSDPVKMGATLIALQQEHEKLLEERRIIGAEIARVSAFGNFSKKELEHLEEESKRVFQFFCMKSDLAREMTLPPELLFVGTEFDLDYFVSIRKERGQYPKMIEIDIRHSLGEWMEQWTSVETQMAHTESEIRLYSNALPRFQAALIEELNAFHLQTAKHDVTKPLGEHLFAVEGWVPQTRLKALQGLLSGLDVVAEEIAVEAKDRVPTCMENKGTLKVGEDLVHVYDTPSPTDRDPSGWVLLFFSLFFAMIISDAGYGILFLLFALLLKWKYPRLAGMGRRFVKLTLILASSCIVWGALTSSYFGIEISPQNPLRKYSLIHWLATKKADYHLKEKDDVYEEWVKEFPEAASAPDGTQFLLKTTADQKGKLEYEALDTFNDNILMEFSLLAGILHVSLSCLRYARRNWAQIGWIVFMIGGYLFFPKILNATTIGNFTGLISKGVAYPLGEQMVYGGMVIAFVLAFFQKRWGALHELTNVIQVFADVLSYLRLYALALAGMIMADTFNTIGVNAGLFAGFLIILIGHLNTIVLSIMGGVIHGLRLNFLEWYHYCFEGGGRVFNPLNLRKFK